MALSQTLEDSPLRFGSKPPGTAGLNPQEVYNERHRLALEELLSGGLGDFLDFLRREKIPNFLSEREIQRISSAAAPPHRASFHGEEQAPEPSLDCSSVTYFPDVSDVEPPLLELGWPAFTAGSYRGVTRAVAHFQPSYGENIYSCKEAARRMIHSAREVIAIVTDSLTDLDIFKDLQEACCHRKVPVYILLDHRAAPAFLKMCRDVGVGLEDLQLMRMRTISGPTFYMRSGARITGDVHERFMLIDGNRVATGSYRFNWSDGKLNSSNLVELSGQITEKFDEEFRILYAQSLPIGPVGPRGPPAVPGSLFEQLVPPSPRGARESPAEPACLTSTPSRRGPKAGPGPHSSTLQADWAGPEEILAGSTARTLGASSCHASTQTAWSLTDSDTQTDVQHPGLTPEGPGPVLEEQNQTEDQNQTQSQTQTQDQTQSQTQAQDQSQSQSQDRAPPAPDPALKDCFQRLSRERLHHYSAIRSKLEHMVSVLSARGGLADVAGGAQALGARSHLRTHRDRLQDPRLAADAAAMGTWPRARCAH